MIGFQVSYARELAYESLIFQSTETRSGTHGTLSVGPSDTGMKTLDELITRNPEEPNSYYYRGFLFASKNLSKNALEDYSKAIELGLRSYKVFVERGFLLFGLGHLQAALASLEEASKIDDSEYEGLLLQGKILNSLKRHKQKAHFSTSGKGTRKSSDTGLPCLVG